MCGGVDGGDLKVASQELSLFFRDAISKVKSQGETVLCVYGYYAGVLGLDQCFGVFWANFHILFGFPD